MQLKKIYTEINFKFFLKLRCEMSNTAEKAIDWQEEAEGVINDVKNHVKLIEISKKLISNTISKFTSFLGIFNVYFVKQTGDGSNVFLNIVLLEGKVRKSLYEFDAFCMSFVEDHKVISNYVN